MLQDLSSVRLAIDTLATRRLWSSTCGTPRFTNRIQKLLWMSSSAPFQHLIVTLLYHQQRCMPTCGNTKGGGVAALHRTMPGVDIKMHWKTNCVCGMVQKTI